MIELFDKDKRDENRKSSKGNQLKFERHGVWYKADYTGYEGMSEVVVSHLLRKSSLKENEFVVYDQEQIRYKSQIYMGASSSNFLDNGEQLITLERLCTNSFGRGLSDVIFRINDHEERLKFLVTKTEELTGLRDFGIYMSKMMAIDAFFLNEDRHTHNIAVVLKGDGSYRCCPFFDHGAGLLADIKMDYPLDGDVYELMDSVQAKTFCTDLDEQLEIAEKLYGRQMSFEFVKRDVDDILDNVQGYEEKAVERVRNIIYEQMGKYEYIMAD